MSKTFKVNQHELEELRHEVSEAIQRCCDMSYKSGLGVSEWESFSTLVSGRMLGFMEELIKGLILERE